MKLIAGISYMGLSITVALNIFSQPLQTESKHLGI